MPRVLSRGRLLVVIGASSHSGMPAGEEIHERGSSELQLIAIMENTGKVVGAFGSVPDLPTASITLLYKE